MDHRLKGGNPNEEESPKSYTTILIQTKENALKQIRRQGGGLFISGISAGLDIGFSLFLMAIVLTLFKGVIPEPFVDFLIASMYPVGFIIVILGRSELFTEHTTIAVLPALSGEVGFSQVFRLWGFIYVGNLIGAILFSSLVNVIGEPLGVVDDWALEELALALLGKEWWIMILSGMLAGWLMGLLAWLVAAARDTISQIVFIWTIIFAIGISHLHHSIAGTVEIFSGVIVSEKISIGDYFYFLILATIGNAIGGVLFVAVLKYSHSILDNEKKS